MRTATDVFIIGGGPAGLAAAIAARQRGLEVIVADGGRALVVAGDVAVPTTASRAADESISAFGGIDILMARLHEAVALAGGPLLPPANVYDVARFRLQPGSGVGKLEWPEHPHDLSLSNRRDQPDDRRRGDRVIFVESHQAVGNCRDPDCPRLANGR